MDAPLLMRGKDVEQDFGIAVGQLADDLPHRLGVYRRSPGDQAFAEGAHPMMILIQRLPARQSSPGSHLLHLGVAGVVADVLAPQPGPERGGRSAGRRLGQGWVSAFRAWWSARHNNKTKYSKKTEKQ